MLILTSYTFNDTAIRQKMNELIPDQNGKMLIIGLALDNIDPPDRLKREVNGITLLDFQQKNVFVFDEHKPDACLHQDYQCIDVIGGNTSTTTNHSCGLRTRTESSITPAAFWMLPVPMVCSTIRFPRS